MPESYIFVNGFYIKQFNSMTEIGYGCITINIGTIGIVR